MFSIMFSIMFPIMFSNMFPIMFLMMSLMMFLMKDQTETIGAELIKFGDEDKRGDWNEMKDVEEGANGRKERIFLHTETTMLE